MSLSVLTLIPESEARNSLKIIKCPIFKHKYFSLEKITVIEARNSSTSWKFENFNLLTFLYRKKLVFFSPDFQLLVDDLLVYNGMLQPVRAGSKGIVPNCDTPQNYHTILFTDNKDIIRKEKHSIIRSVSSMPICLYALTYRGNTTTIKIDLIKSMITLPKVKRHKYLWPLVHFLLPNSVCSIERGYSWSFVICIKYTSSNYEWQYNVHVFSMCLCLDRPVWGQNVALIDKINSRHLKGQFSSFLHVNSALLSTCIN